MIYNISQLREYIYHLHWGLPITYTPLTRSIYPADLGCDGCDSRVVYHNSRTSNPGHHIREIMKCLLCLIYEPKTRALSIIQITHQLLSGNSISRPIFLLRSERDDRN
jgi:hypothetical protein